MRATLGTSGMAMAMMVLVSEGPERRGHDQRHHQQRQRLHDVDQALHDEIEPAAEEARHEAHHHADQAPERCRTEPHRQRDARAVDDAREHIAAHEIGAERVLVAGGGERRARIGGQRIVGGDGVGEHGGGHEGNHDERADGAQRIAPHEEQQPRPAGYRR